MIHRIENCKFCGRPLYVYNSNLLSHIQSQSVCMECKHPSRGMVDGIVSSILGIKF